MTGITCSLKKNESLARLIKKREREGTNYGLCGMTGDITTDTLDFKRLIREHYEEVCIYRIPGRFFTI